jgi:hypothetical protein
MKVMSFKNWQNSKTYTSLDNYSSEDNVSGYLYAKSAYIEDAHTWVDLPPQKELLLRSIIPRWYLLLDKDEYQSDDLEELEKKLYDWLVDEELIKPSMSYLDGDEWLTKQEVIDEIMDRVQKQLWRSKDDSIVEFATTVGVNIVAITNGLFWKKIDEKD